MKSIIALAVVVATLAGCAIVPVPVGPVYVGGHYGYGHGGYWGGGGKQMKQPPQV